MQEKLYYIVEGLAYKNKYGRTILSYDRMAHINSEMIAKFPLVEYLCAEVPRPPDGAERKWTLDDFEKWRERFDEGNDMNFVPTESVVDFLWTYVLPSNDTQNRINKTLRNGENLDHDDMFAYLPPASAQVVTDVCKATTGSKKFLTVEGYCNAFPGFSEYLRNLSVKGNRNKLMEGIKSYVRFEAIMTNKWDKGNETYQRLDDDMLSSGTIVTAESPQEYISQLNEVMQQVAYAYNDPRLNHIVSTIYGSKDTKHLNPRNSEHKKVLDNLTRAIELFDDVFSEVVRSDNGRKMTTIIARSNLLGMGDYFKLSNEEIENRKQSKKEKLGYKLEY